MNNTILSAKFYQRKATLVAKELLGKLLVHKSPEGITAGMIVETEAYIGSCDKACHAYKNRSKRTEIMFHEGGCTYVYMIYGMYYCFNVVTGKKDEGDAVLIRALEPVKGIDLMHKYRGTKITDKNLCNGPGKLCQAMMINKELYGEPLTGKNLYIENYKKIKDSDIMSGPRINVDYAGTDKDLPWRFYIADNKYKSNR